MGVPVLFTDAATPDLIVVPHPGLYLSDELFLGDDLYLDDGPTLDFYAVAPDVAAFGVTVTVDAGIATFSATDPVLVGVEEVTVAVVPVQVLFDAASPDITGHDLVVVVDSAGLVTFSATVPETSGGQLLILVPSVRELPPLRLHHVIVTPSGRHFRWAEDDPNPSRVPSGVRFSDTMPGGYETADATLPRKPSDDSVDLERLSTWNILGAGGEKAWEGRIERVPRLSGGEVAVTPSGAGWQAALDDDKSATMVYVDQDFSKWSGASAARNSSLPTLKFNDPSVLSNDIENDPLFGRPELWATHTANWVAAGLPLTEGWYDAGPGVDIALVYFGWRTAKNVDGTDIHWHWFMYAADNDNPAAGQFNASPDLRTPSGVGNVTVGSLTAPPNTHRRHAFFQFYYDQASLMADGIDTALAWTHLAVYGNHGRPLIGPQTQTAAPGMLASDIVAHAVKRWAPTLNVTEGPNGSVRASSFVIPQMVFSDRTSAGDIVRTASRFGLQDFGCWDNQTFFWHDRGVDSRHWRARVGPAELQETGPQVDRLWNSVMVQYTDVDGSTRTVGPPGSGANFEDPDLYDPDPTNPATAAGIKRRALLQMGTSANDPFTGRPSNPIEIGRKFLAESKLLDGSGQARFVGHVEDDRGVLHPYWAPRSGDTVTFVDAQDVSNRRIVRTDKDHGSRTCSIDLDAPPQGLDALLERLGVVLVPLGIN